jgi:hypothetical protein
MKINIIVTSIALLLFAQIGKSQTTVSGGIFSNTTWTLANSPYVMTGNIVVFPGATLSIEPGVEVRVQENGLSGTQYYLEARGTINMVGQPGARITFRADTAITTVGTWAGFKIKNSQGGAINYDYVSISNAVKCFDYDALLPSLIDLHESDFSYNYYAITVGTELIAQDCNFIGNDNAVYGWSIFTFSNCVFQDNVGALSIYASSLNINNSTFTNNNFGILLNSTSVNGTNVKNTTFEGNDVAFDNAVNGIIDSCTFTNNLEAIKNTIYLEVTNSDFIDNGTALQVGFGTTVRDCQIESNETGIALGPINYGQPVPIIENNRICFNEAYNIDNRTDLNLFIPTNCFCSTDSTEVENKIFDGYDDITKGLISYAIFDTSCTSVLRLVQKAGQSVGIGDNQRSAELLVFPNPFAENLFLTNLKGYKTYQLFSVQGQLIQGGHLVDGKNSIQLSQEMPAGTYFLVLKDANHSSEFIKVIHN